MTESTFHFFAMGSLLGLSAGFSPGPLLTLAIAQTMKYNQKEGIKVALSPLITDLPIILLALLVFSQLSQFNTVLASISFVGGVFIAYLGIGSLKTKGFNMDAANSSSQSLKKGIIANLLSPGPYMFWATVGAPLLFKALDLSLPAVILFMSSFYICLIGSKMLAAVIVGRTKAFINQRLYMLIMRFLGLALLVFSILFFYDGLRYLELV